MFLGLLCSFNPDFVPDYYSSFEPIRTAFDKNNLKEPLQTWGRTFLWKRNSPRSEGTVNTAWGARPQHGWFTLSVELRKSNIETLTRFFQTASDRLRADFAFLHLLTPEDIVTGTANGTVFCLDPKKERYSLTVTTHDLVKYIPDLYWATIFGSAYVKFFGRERLLAAPAFVVRELPGGGIYLQLSEKLTDLQTDFASVAAERNKIKKFLNQSSFFSVESPVDYTYPVPIFDFR